MMFRPPLIAGLGLLALLLTLPLNAGRAHPASADGPGATAAAAATVAHPPLRIPPGLAQATFASWKRQFMAAHGLSEAEFARRIEVTGVELADGPMYVWVRIDYFLVIDWVRAHQAASIELGEYPLKRPPDAASIDRSVARLLSLRPADRVALPIVVSQARAEAALRTCDTRMSGDWDGIRFENVTGRLLLHGRAPSNGPNQCRRGAVDLGSGELTECLDTPCAIFGTP